MLIAVAMTKVDEAIGGLCELNLQHLRSILNSSVLAGDSHEMVLTAELDRCLVGMQLERE